MPFVIEGNTGTWKPTKQQAKFLSLPDTIKEAFYGGAAGGGKSEVLLTYPIIRQWYKNPRFKQVFMRRTYPELRNEIVPRSREFYLKLGAKFSKQEMTWTFPREDQYGSGFNPDGAMILLAHCENEDDVHNFDSMEINLFSPDELTSHTEWIYTYVGFTRVRTSDHTLPAIIRAAGMPGDIGHSWVKKRFIDPAKDGNKIIIGKGGIKRIFIKALQSDNPYVDPSYAQSLEGLPEAELQAKKYGSWDAYQGRVFEEFRERHYPDEPDNALHVIEPFDIPEFWPRIVSIDWGYAAPAKTAIGYYAISPTRRVYKYREGSYQNVKIEEWCSYEKEAIHNEKPRVIKLCKSAGQDRGQEHTIHQQIESALSYPVELVNASAGSRIAGKMLLHEYFRWKPKYIPKKEQTKYNYEHAEWLLRNRPEEYNSYINSFIPPEPEDNIPKLLIFNTCKETIEAIKICSYDKTNPEDVAEFPGDDFYDETRYGIDAADRYFKESSDALVEVQRREKITKMYNEKHDMTAFYRNARMLEKKSQGPTAIRRYHHVR